MPTTLPFYKRSWFNWLILLLVATVLGWWFYQKGNRPFADVGFVVGREVGKTPAFTSENKVGSIVIKDSATGINFKIPSSFKQERNNTYYQNDLEYCKLTFDRLRQTNTDFQIWIREREAAADVEIVSRDLKKVDHQNLEIYRYSLKINDLGENQILYLKKRGEKDVVQVVAFGDDPNTCYKNLDYIILNSELK